MANSSYAIYMKNDGSGNLRVVAYRDPSTIPSCASSGAALNVPVTLNSWGNSKAAALSAATNAQPIVVTAAAGHGIVTGDVVFVQGVLGNTAANGTWLCTVSTNAITLTGSLGNAAYTSGGTIMKLATTKDFYEALQTGVLAVQADIAAGN